MTATVHRYGLLAAIIVALSGATLEAQAPRQIGMQLVALSDRGRSSSPIPLQIKLEYNSNKILEGDLLLEVYNSVPDSSDLMATIRYEGIVLQGADLFLRTVLPPLEHSFNKQYLIVGWFQTESGRLSLSRDADNPAEPHELLSIGSFERSTLICSVSGKRDFQRPSRNRAFLNNALSLQAYDPALPIDLNDQRLDSRRGAQDTRRVQTNAVSWKVSDLPEDPLYFCCFDMVLLADSSLSRLEKMQMQALTTWVEAGGSLCVLPDDNRLTNSHLQFLQTLFEQEADPDFHLSLTDEGELLIICEDADPLVNRRFGLGRVTLLPARTNLSTRLTGTELGTVVGHLWKARSDSRIFDGEKWDVRTVEDALAERGQERKKDNRGYFVDRGSSGQNDRSYQRAGTLEEFEMQNDLYYELQPRSNPLTDACETALMPLGVEMVPTYVIALLLIAYVVIIGPVDYLVLGFFRARKYTWLMFPLVTALFTALTVQIAHHYMASTETGGRMSIVDLVDGGRPVRQTDLQMHFYASQSTLTNTAEHAFVVPAQMMSNNSNQFRGQPSPRTINRQIHYSGRFPQTFVVQQSMRQWEPQLNRKMTLTPDAVDMPQLPWDDADLVVNADGRLRLAELLQQLPLKNCLMDAVVLHESQQLPLFPRDGFMFSDDQLSRGQAWFNGDPWQRQRQSPPHDAVAAVGVIQSAARVGTRDFLSVVSQVAPQGSASMEDLTILDPTDPDQWLLIVAIKKDSDTHIYRRLHVIDRPDE